jgi:ABC-type multidrug transport system fused ATPase/permease subunit
MYTKSKLYIIPCNIYTQNSNGHILKNISFSVKKGQVVSIIGPVGSGKSSLLQAILGELPLASGSVEARGRVAYTSQDPWVFGGTMRDNVLFGEDYKEEWYNMVTEACCLSEDIDKLLYGDMTLVGERGVSLSGGQRARVNLARSVYKKGDIYLLDDPLSAVDPGIEHHIFDQCISDVLDNCAVVLVTHQLPIAHMTDHVIVMHKGRAIAQGSFEDILEIAENDADSPLGRDLHEVLREFLTESDYEDDTDVFDDSRPCTPEELPSPLQRPRPTRLQSFKKPKLIKRVTDLALMRQSSVRLSSSRMLTKLDLGLHSLQNTNRLTRKSTNANMGGRFMQRRSTVAGFGHEISNLHGLKVGLSLKELKGGPLVTLASSRCDYNADEDSHDYSVFANSIPSHSARVFPRSIKLPSAANTPTTPATPIRKKSMATFLANQFPERLSEEDEDFVNGRSPFSSPNHETEQGPFDDEEEPPEDEHLEDKGHGKISMKTYYNYFIHGSGYVLGCVVILLFVFSQSALILGDWWLAVWAESNSTCSSPNATAKDFCHLQTNQRIGIYAGLVGSSTLLAFTRAILFFYICIRAAKKLHNITFSAVLRMPTRFFDINPIGRILNRFSKDIGFLDDILPNTFYDYLTIMFHFLAIMIFASVANYFIVFPMIALIIVFLAMRFYYLKSSQEIKRLEAVVRSPLYSHVSNTLLGLSTIHALKKEDMFIEWFHTYQNENTKGWSAYITSTRWFGLRVDVFSALFIAIVAFLAIPLSSVENLMIMRNLIGLSLVYCISLSGVFQYGVRLSTEVESLMVSAERLMAYNNFPSESSLVTTSSLKKPTSDWPDKGCIKFEGLNFQYSKRGPYVLKSISCQIDAAEKVGIVGRSGAGKSSILCALFRLAEPEGILEIDGIQITDIGLHDLRSKISIIPQV